MASQVISTKLTATVVFSRHKRNVGVPLMTLNLATNIGDGPMIKSIPTSGEWEDYIYHAEVLAWISDHM